MSLRRIALWMLLFAALAGFAVVARLHLAGRWTLPPGADGRPAREAIEAAEAMGAVDYLPTFRTASAHHVEEAVAGIRRQLATIWPLRDFREAGRILAQAHAEALLLYRSARDRSLADRLAAQELVAYIGQELAAANGLLSHTSGESQVRRNAAAARIRREDALAQRARGRHAEALRAAQESLGFLRLACRDSREILARFDDPANLELWRDWIESALRVSRRQGSVLLVVVKEQHRLDVYRAGRLERSMPVDLGANALRQKLRQGDRATPEGTYRVVQKKNFGASVFGQALLIDYPNAADRRRHQQARTSGAIPRGAGIGSLIEIHGKGGRGTDWTDGCVAPSDEDMQWLFGRTAVGTPVVIVGSDGTAGPIRASLKDSTHVRTP